MLEYLPLICLVSGFLIGVLSTASFVWLTKTDNQPELPMHTVKTKTTNFDGNKKCIGIEEIIQEEYSHQYTHLAPTNVEEE